MKRQAKVDQVAALQEQFKDVKNAFLVGFSGLTVEAVSDLRRKVRATESSYRVVKNRLARIASRDTPLEHIQEHFRDCTAVAYNAADPVALAKTLADFAKDNPALSLRIGVLDGTQVVTDKQVEALAKLPSLPELQATLLSLIQTPAMQLARLIQTPAAQLAQVIRARQQEMSETQD